MSGPDSEFANFGNHDVMMGLSSNEDASWLELTEQDLINGINETRRDRILRTYVRNTYRYHLHEIYSTLRNEYTDWERGEPNSFAIRDGLLSLLSDGQVAAPMLKLALLHSASGAGRGYFFHFQSSPIDKDEKQQRPQNAKELSYLLGMPIFNRISVTSSEIGGPYLAGNYSAEDETLARLLVYYLSNFVRRG